MVQSLEALTQITLALLPLPMSLSLSPTASMMGSPFLPPIVWQTPQPLVYGCEGTGAGWGAAQSRTHDPLAAPDGPWGKGVPNPMHLCLREPHTYTALTEYAFCVQDINLRTQLLTTTEE